LTEEKKYYSIGEVGKSTNLQPYVLRFWESEFPQLHPRKSKSGRRIYSEADVKLILHLKELLYEKKFTIEGAKLLLSEETQTKKNQTEISFSNRNYEAVLKVIKSELKEIIALLD
jgi:DNA-binding transcriptional MerR regulator